MREKTYPFENMEWYNSLKGWLVSHSVYGAYPRWNDIAEAAHQRSDCLLKTIWWPQMQSSFQAPLR